MVAINIPDSALVVAASAVLAAYVAYRAVKEAAQQGPAPTIDASTLMAAMQAMEAHKYPGAVHSIGPLDTPRIERRRKLREEALEGIPTAVPTSVPSMEDCVKMQENAKAELSNLTPAMVLNNLQQGNARFWMGVAQRPEMSAMERRAMIIQQFPKAAVLGCSDSRVPIEIVFDQGLGDIFAIRVAGNSCAGEGGTASLEYAVNHLKVKVVMILGHEGCGAVRAAMLPAEQIGAEPRHLRHWLATIRRGLITHDGLDQNLIRDARARDREAVICNVREQLKTLAKDANLMAKVREGSLLIVGGFYEISSGMVDFIEMDPLDTEDPKASDEKKSQPPPNGRGGYMQSRKLSDHFERGTPGTTPEVSRRATPHRPPEAYPPSAARGDIFAATDPDDSCLPCDNSAPLATLSS